ncbi:sulfotransferase domain-containing protein [Candidatus Bipolaricaulota bacterium]
MHRRQGLNNNDSIVIVTGLPRSGTSMMMRMLDVAGLDVLTDRIRSPDEDNPRGYYEFELVKDLPENTRWLSGARGKAVKMASALLPHLPSSYNYLVIFMERDLGEVLASQTRMLERLERPNPTPAAKMRKLYESHLAEVRAWLQNQSNMDTVFINYNRILRDPHSVIPPLKSLLGEDLDFGAMCKIVEPGLYRQRAAEG